MKPQSVAPRKQRNVVHMSSPSTTTAVIESAKIDRRARKRARSGGGDVPDGRQPARAATTNLRTSGRRPVSERRAAERRHDAQMKSAGMSTRFIQNARASLDQAARNTIISEVINELFGFGPIQPLLDDPAVTEIMVNRAEQRLRRAQGQAASGRRSSSTTTRTSAARSSASSRRSAGASDRIPRWSMRACRTARA